MDNQDVKILLEKYWECETSITEENLLKTYFSQVNISPELMPYKEYFVPLYDISQVQGDFHLEDKIPTAKVIKLNLRKYMYAVAAVLVLGICSIWLVKSNLTDTNTRQMVEVQDPDEALRIATDALAMLSSKMRTGAQAVEENIHYVEKVNIIK